MGWVFSWDENFRAFALLYCWLLLDILWPSHPLPQRSKHQKSEAFRLEPPLTNSDQKPGRVLFKGLSKS